MAGFQHSEQAKGGRFLYKNPVLRYIGATAEADINKFISDNAKAVQLNAAKVMIDSAIVVKGKDAYPWGKAALQAGIDANTADYNALEAKESTAILNAARAMHHGDRSRLAHRGCATCADSSMPTMARTRPIPTCGGHQRRTGRL